MDGELERIGGHRDDVNERNEDDDEGSDDEDDDEEDYWDFDSDAEPDVVIPPDFEDFEDNDDREAFTDTGISKNDYLNEILLLKHDNEHLNCFALNGVDRMTNEAWAMLGVFLQRVFLSKNTNLRKIFIGGCDLTANELALLVGNGPFDNNLIENLSLWGNHRIGSEGVTVLKPFFKKASSLKLLNLVNTNLGREGMKLLSLELDGLPNLTHLILSRNKIGDKGLEGISTMCFSKLTRLDLGWNNIALRGSEVIADFLRSEESSLVELILTANAIDDECAEILAKSLSKNTKLEVLWLGYNRNISPEGLEHFRHLVCDTSSESTSSLSALYGSNHTLREINDKEDKAFQPDCMQPITQQLEWALTLNGRPGAPKDKAYRKIIEHQFEEGNDIVPHLDMDVKLMPNVFGWIKQRSDEEFENGCRCNFVYRILQNMNVCNFALLPQNDLPPQCSVVDGGSKDSANLGSSERRSEELGTEGDRPAQRRRLN